MTTFTDTFDGVINTPLVGRTGWVALKGSEDVLLLNGSGAVKDTGGGYEKSAGHDTGSQDHYVKAIVGAGFVAQTDAKVILAIAASVGDSWWGIGYRSTTNLMRLRGYGGYEEDIAGGALVAGDELELTWKYSTGLLTIKRNGTTVGTKTWEGSSPGTGTHTGVLMLDSRAAQDDVFRSWESGELLAEVVPDTTPPTLTLPTVTATGTATVTGGITSNEAGPAWAILSTSATKPTAAQIKVGQNHLGTASPAATATLVVGANPGAFDFSGLTPNTGYYLHVVQDDTATVPNTSAPVTSPPCTTDAIPATVTLPPFTNNVGVLWANETGVTLHFSEVDSGDKVVTLTGQTTDASAVLTASSLSLAAGTEYRCVVVLASGEEGLYKVTPT